MLDFVSFNMPFPSHTNKYICDFNRLNVNLSLDCEENI